MFEFIQTAKQHQADVDKYMALADAESNEYRRQSWLQAADYSRSFRNEELRWGIAFVIGPMIASVLLTAYAFI